MQKFKTTTFALWNPGNPQDISVIEKNLSKLHSDIVILGLNPSKDITFPHNFHWRGKFDGWCREAFSEAPFQGAFITDLISYPQANSRIVVEKWKKRKSFRDKNIKRLQDQFKVLGVRKPTVICLGKNTHELLCEANISTGKVYFLKHPNSYRIANARKAFISDAKKLAKILDAQRQSKS